jgi:predicted nucleotidyltransferase
MVESSSILALSKRRLASRKFRVVQEFQLKQAIPFGSYAYGTPTNDSDALLN